MNDETRDYEPADDLPVQRTVLPEGMKFVDVETSLDGLVTEKRAFTRYLPQGYATPTWVHVADEAGDKTYTLIIHPLTGKAEIRDGRVEMQRRR